MKLELHSASNFITYILRSNRCPINNCKLNQLWINLNKMMYIKYRDHWFISKPNKGSGYRCIRCNESHTDLLITEAGRLSNIPELTLKKYLPFELTLWIDPGEVYYRIGNGYLCVLYTSDDQQAWRPTYNTVKTTSLSSFNYSKTFKQFIYQIKKLVKKYVHNYCKKYVQK